MKGIMKYIIALLIPFTVYSSERYKGDYDTIQIRTIWMICHYAAMERPDYDQRTAFKLCDCFVDQLRQSMTFIEWHNAPKALQYRMSQEFAKQCLLSLNESLNDDAI